MPAEWTAQECAEHWGVGVKTWYSYAARNQVPQPARHVGRTPVWDPETVRTAAADRPRAGQLTDIRLPLTDVLRPLRLDMATAIDASTAEGDRHRTTADALQTLRLLRKVLQEMGEVADLRCREEYERSEADTNDRDADERRLIWAALSDDLRRADAELDRRRRRFYTAAHPDEEGLE